LCPILRFPRELHIWHSGKKKRGEFKEPVDLALNFKNQAILAADLNHYRTKPLIYPIGRGLFSIADAVVAESDFFAHVFLQK